MNTAAQALSQLVSPWRPVPRLINSTQASSVQGAGPTTYVSSIRTILAETESWHKVVLPPDTVCRRTRMGQDVLASFVYEGCTLVTSKTSAMQV